LEMYKNFIEYSAVGIKRQQTLKAQQTLVEVTINTLASLLFTKDCLNRGMGDECAKYFGLIGAGSLLGNWDNQMSRYDRLKQVASDTLSNANSLLVTYAGTECWARNWSRCFASLAALAAWNRLA